MAISAERRETCVAALEGEEEEEEVSRATISESHVRCRRKTVENENRKSGGSDGSSGSSSSGNSISNSSSGVAVIVDTGGEINIVGCSDTGGERRRADQAETRSGRERSDREEEKRITRGVGKRREVREAKEVPRWWSRSGLRLRLMGAVSDFVGILGQTPGPAVSAGSAGVAAVVAAAAAASVAAAVAVVVADDVAAAVMRVRHHLVGHVLLVRAEELLQPDDGGDHEGDLAHEQRLTGYHRDRAQRERQQRGCLQRHRHHQRSQDLLRLFCNTMSKDRVLA